METSTKENQKIIKPFYRADIVLFPFPYTDLKNRKLRPCLVLSSKMNEDILLCQITSKKIKQDSYSVEIKKENTLDGSLEIDSYIRTNMLFTANIPQIKLKICSLKKEDYSKVVDKIINLISKK